MLDLKMKKNMVVIIYLSKFITELNGQFNWVD
jgi:beta-mannanase